MNTRLLRKVQRHILEEPKRYDQDRWLIRGDEATIHLEPNDVPACKTVGCIAGWVCVLGKSIPKLAYNSGIRAKKLLGLTTGQADRLFAPILYADANHCWPEKFETKYRKANTAKKRAKVAAARIDHFIKTKGAE